MIHALSLGLALLGLWLLLSGIYDVRYKRGIIMLRLLLILLAFAAPAKAGTVVQAIDYNFLSGPLAGTTLEVRYSYPTLPYGQIIEAYSPQPKAHATYLDAHSDVYTHSLLVFSGSSNILQPEPYFSFVFDPATNATGLKNFEIWNVAGIGIFFEGDPDIRVHTCGQTVACDFQTTVIPLPATAPLLLGSLGLGLVSRRFRRPA